MIKVRLLNHFQVLKNILFKRKLIINYQMGKVGSSTVANYFRSEGIFEWHIHRFYDTPVHRVANKNIVLKIIDRSLLMMAKMYCKEIKVVTGIRDPFKRDVSMFFHNYEVYYSNTELTKKNLPQIVSIFKDNFPIAASVNWFDEEFKKAIGVDVYKFQFSNDKGFLQIKQGKFDILIFEMTKIDVLLNEFKDFFEDDNYVLKRVNTASNKSYNELYKQFLEVTTHDFHDDERYINSTYYKHFYE
jgi:hypothetical protein